MSDKLKKIIYIIASAVLSIATLVACILYPFWNRSNLTDTPIPESDAGLTLHFIDVGQGDCTLIESKGRFALIDGGEYKERNKVISYLSLVGVQELDFIIATHPHSDHIGGLSEVIRHFNPSLLLLPDVESDSWEYVLDAADERNAICETPKPYDTYKIGSATLTVLSPDSEEVYSNLNNYSIVTRVEYGDSSFMLTGDAEALVEKSLVQSESDLSADVLKCGHHGSSTSSCDAFLDAVNPQAAIISCGKDNDYGHPHKEVIKALDERNIPVWRTDLAGSIKATTDGDKIYISTNDATTEVNSLPTPTQAETAPYIGNRNSKVFHLNTCGGIKDMKDKNKVEFSNREDATKAGYKPCASCKP